MTTPNPDAVDPALDDSSNLGIAIRLILVLAAGLLLRSMHSSQPIVENYVGRQIPTAMVARNLDRGSGFLRPQMETAPTPNYFLVEPPLYQSLVVGLKRAAGLSLDVSGRLVSAIAATMAAWGIYVLVKRRQGEAAAIAAAAAFSMLPITLRYGRAFQPDALMLGGCVAGLACWDASVRNGDRRWVVAGWFLLVVGIAAKATAAYVLAVAFLAVFPRRNLKTLLLCGSTLLPVVAWYVWAGLLASAEGSRASAENRDLWLNLIGLEALGSPETWKGIGRFLLVRAFTPLGVLGAVWGLAWSSGRRGETSLWWTWAGGATIVMALVAAKLHHEYYWLCLAPPVAAGLGIAWLRIDTWRPSVALLVASAFAMLSLAVAGSTWRVPEEWEGIQTAAAAVADATARDDLVVAPEALLYYSDRKGCRLEYTFIAATRAAGEWGPVKGGLSSIGLVEFYRTKGARWFADVGAGADDDDPRLDLHDEIRRRYKIVIDRPDVLLAELPPSETFGHGD